MLWRKKKRKIEKKTIFFNTEVNDFRERKRVLLHGVCVCVCVCVCVWVCVCVCVWVGGTWLNKAKTSLSFIYFSSFFVFRPAALSPLDTMKVGRTFLSECCALRRSASRRHRPSDNRRKKKEQRSM